MIVNSDNYATVLLYEHIDTIALANLFSALELNFTGFGQMVYEVNCADYSKFFQVLYNATYLTQEDSEYALSLLTKTDFKLGLCKPIPANINVAHKFGENNTDDSKQLHESGIVYLDNNPYLITVMTTGYDVKNLPDIISEISGKVYAYMKN
jgi:beta-lactamase class A